MPGHRWSWQVSLNLILSHGVSGFKCQLGVSNKSYTRLYVELGAINAWDLDCCGHVKCCNDNRIKALVQYMIAAIFRLNSSSGSYSSLFLESSDKVKSFARQSWLFQPAKLSAAIYLVPTSYFSR